LKNKKKLFMTALSLASLFCWRGRPERKLPISKEIKDELNSLEKLLGEMLQISYIKKVPEGQEKRGAASYKPKKRGRERDFSPPRKAGTVKRNVGCREERRIPLKECSFL